MSNPAPRNRRAKLAVVRRTERITPHMIRVVLSCDDFVDNGTSDHYVKLLFPQPGVEYPDPLDMGVVREHFALRYVAGATDSFPGGALSGHTATIYLHVVTNVAPLRSSPRTARPCGRTRCAPGTRRATN